VRDVVVVQPRRPAGQELFPCAARALSGLALQGMREPFPFSWYLRLAVPIGTGLFVVGGLVSRSWQPIVIGLAVLIPYIILGLRARRDR
jgi:hypothetical protein